MSWDNEKVLSFIKEYERRPILWKKDDKLYHNVLKKEDAWREISLIFGEETDVLKKKMESLRGSRRREKNRVVSSVGTGKGQKDIYVSKWFAWESLKFLDDPEDLRATSTNYPAFENEEGDKDNTENSGENNDDVIDGSNEEDSQQEFQNSNPAEKVNPAKKSPKKPAPTRKRTKDPRLEEAYSILKRTTTAKKDECAMFGDFIAEKLRKLGHRQRAILQHEIHNLVFQAEMATPHTSQPSSQLSTLHNAITSSESSSSSSYSVYPTPTPFPHSSPSPIASPDHHI